MYQEFPHFQLRPKFSAMEAFFRRTVTLRLPARTVTVDGTLSAATGEPNDGVDRISALPDDLRRSIVSRLPVKDAVRTTVLSTRWRCVWHSTPLVFYDTHLDPNDEPARVAAADRVLAGHPGPFHTVHLAALCSFDHRERELGRWSRLLAAGGVRNLALVGPTGGMDLLRLPVDILRCAKLERLYLGVWRFPDTADLPEGTGVFPHLRELTMVFITFYEDHDLDHILASSPVLDTLALCLSVGRLEHVRLRGQRLQCVLFWQSMAMDLEVVDSPLLKHLIMWDTSPPAPGPGGDVSLMGVRIPKGAPELKVLGYLEPRIHELRIRNTVIKVDTKVSPRTMLPSIKVLALKVNLGVFKEVQMLFSFIRCFPNIETLHVESARAGEPTGKDYSEFFRELSPIECVQSHIKMVVLHEFNADLSEVMFIKYITQRANELKKLTLVVSRRATIGEMMYVLNTLATSQWASETCMVLLMAPKEEQGLNFHRASDLSVEDPFLEYGEELLRFIKNGESFEQTKKVSKVSKLAVVGTSKSSS